MSDALHHFIAGDLVALLACTLAVMTCGVLGSYLVLKRESLMGDAISHAVLPGLVILRSTRMARIGKLLRVQHCLREKDKGLCS